MEEGHARCEPFLKSIPTVGTVRSLRRGCLSIALLAMLILMPAVVVAQVLITEWRTRPSQRGWLVLGFGYYIAGALRHLWTKLSQLCMENFYLRLELRRMNNSTLFDAVTEALASEAEKTGDSCSPDQDIMQDHDSLTGKLTIKLRYWGSQNRTVYVRLYPGDPSEAEEGVHICVCFKPGEDVVCGREHRLQRREVLVIWARTSPANVMSHKDLVIRWLEGAYQNYVKPVKNVVDINALQESSSDWVPEWKFERARPCKNVELTGQGFFLKNQCINNTLLDAKLWASTALRVYLIMGPPGVGKSEVTVWIAGQLGLPIYRLSLLSGTLSDERLAQLLSPSSLKVDSVVVQVDEFQETLDEWLNSKNNQGSPKTGVTPEGFCQVLQGASAMERGVVILTGTGELDEGDIQNKLPALYRRIHVITRFPWMTREEVAMFFQKFLVRYIPGHIEVPWIEWADRFLQCPCWSEGKPVSVDMMKQFLMRQITKSSELGYGHFTKSDGIQEQVFQISPSALHTFGDLVTSREDADSFVSNYAPVSPVKMRSHRKSCQAASGA